MAAAAASPPRPPSVLGLRISPRARLQLGLFLLAYLLYSLGRWLSVGDLPSARAHALWIVHLERHLGVADEASIQDALTGSAALWVLNHLYLAAQLVVVPGALVWLYRRSRPLYERLRNTVLATWLISLPVYALFPVAPPRLAGIGMVDTITSQTGFAMDSKLTTVFYNELAAVPSLHVGFAVAVGIAVAAAVRHPAAKALALLWGPAIALAVVATGNHFVFDIAAGVVVSALGYLVGAVAAAAIARRRLAAKLAQHVPDMLRYRRDARRADVVHLQWLPVEALDVALRPTGRPLVFTAHRPMPTDGRPTQDWGRRRIYERVDAVVVHTAAARARLTGELGVDPAKVHRIPHGVFEHLARQPDERPLPAELAGVEGPVVLYLGVWRPEHGIDVLLRAWEGVAGAELWVVGLPKMDPAPLRAMAPPGVRFLERFVTDPELPAFFRRADLVVLPYHRVEASGVLFTTLAFGRPVLATAVGGFLEFAETGTVAAVPPGDPRALHEALVRLVGDPAERERLAAAARAAAAGPYSWDSIAGQTLDLYERLLAAR